jgi:hypothetical protein
MAFDVKTQGIPQLINRLQGFEKDVYKVLQRDIKDASDMIGASARGLLPQDEAARNWGPWGAGQFDFYGPNVASTIKPGVRTRSIGGQRYVMGIVTSKSMSFVKYAFIGRNDNSRLGSYINSRYGVSYPRAIGPAWTMHVDKVRSSIQDAINRAAEKVNRG